MALSVHPYKTRRRPVLDPVHRKHTDQQQRTSAHQRALTTRLQVQQTPQQPPIATLNPQSLPNRFNPQDQIGPNQIHTQIGNPEPNQNPHHDIPPPTPPTNPHHPKQKQPAPLTLSQKLTHLSTPLHPLLNVTTGLPHPSFPRTLLHYHLLTHAQLDELASYYHQRTPGPWMFAYPYTEGREGCGESERGDGRTGRGCMWGNGGEGKALGWSRYGMGLESKRRKFGRFCGLRGCESPISPEADADADASKAFVLETAAGEAVREGMEMEVDGEEDREEEGVMMVLDGVEYADANAEREREREVRERMEREWRAAVRRGREEEERREKVGGRRFW